MEAADSSATWVLPTVPMASAPDSGTVRFFGEEGEESVRDSTAVHLEIGASTDYTAEQFYEDTFVDSISLGRRLVSSPESRVAGVLLASFSGTRSARRTSWAVQNELGIGDRLQRDALGGTWRTSLPNWRLSLAPRLEYRRDRTFDRDLEEWRGAFHGRARRAIGDASTAAEFGLGGDFLRTAGSGAEFLPDRNSGRASFALDHAGFSAAEWRAGYSVAARQFPDSTTRDHLEHGWEVRWKRTLSSGHSWWLETEGVRRVTVDPAPTSRDNFWSGEAAMEGELRFGERAALKGRVEAEAMRYDLEDSSGFFDYRVLRARLAPRIERTNWNASAGPRVEALFSDREPAEEYREIGGSAEWEYFGGSSWWSIAPSGGWREYASERVADPFLAPPLHSSYAYYEISILGDQPLPGATRLRLSATGRYEAHADSRQDARGLYFSVDVRRLF